MLEILTAPPVDLLDLETTKADVAALLAMTPVDDTYLGKLIARASAAAQSYVGRPLGLGSYKETVYVEGETSVLMLSRWPIQTVQGITLDGEPLDESVTWTLEEGGYLSVRPRCWPRGLISVSYDAGYSPIPGDVEEATLLILKQSLGGMESVPGMKSLGVGDVSVSWGPGGLPSDAMARLDPYRIPGVC
ncbi:hypothetical protein [Rhodospirillum sp. A1_3_36]|uniref:hypothetical protein n=1 Tax=Rhodospirillum sp. A1_3_36 TaxID=3391666 RepID=UPI0039A5076A